jgi:predicted ATPase
VWYLLVFISLLDSFIDIKYEYDRRLLAELFRLGVVLVTTSNRAPDELYQNGIQRQSFLPAIELLKERCLVHSLSSGLDYRKQSRTFCFF